MGERASVFAGCAYPGVRTGRRHQATCSCGWEGPHRRKLSLAIADQDEHVSPAEVEGFLSQIRAEAEQAEGKGSE